MQPPDVAPKVAPKVAPGLDALVARIRACRICRDAPLGRPLPHEPRPVLVPSATAKVLIASQAPGTKVHLSGVPLYPTLGDRLRDWLGVSTFAVADGTSTGRGSCGSGRPSGASRQILQARIRATSASSPGATFGATFGATSRRLHSAGS